MLVTGREAQCARKGLGRLTAMKQRDHVDRREVGRLAEIRTTSGEDSNCYWMREYTLVCGNCGVMGDFRL